MKDMTHDAGEIRFTLGHGINDERKSKEINFDTISWAELDARILKPAIAPEKLCADWSILSTMNGPLARDHAAQRETGKYCGALFDVDKGGPSLEAIRAALDAIDIDMTIRFWTTWSATAEEPRWRIAIEFEEQVPGDLYKHVCAEVSEMLKRQGITADSSGGRPGQIQFLPSVRSDDAFYEYDLELGNPLDLERSGILKAAKARKAAEERLEAEAVAEMAKRRPKLGESSPIDRFNADKSVAEMLRHCGYTPKPRDPMHWRSPLQKSGSFATKIMADGQSWYSLSGSDLEAGIGRKAKSGGVFGDAFDLFKFFCFGNDEKAALADLKRQRDAKAKTAPASPSSILPPLDPVEDDEAELAALAELDSERAKAETAIDLNWMIDDCPSGLVRELATRILGGQERLMPGLSAMSALSMVSVAARGWVVDWHYRTALNLYVTLVADSGTGKSPLLAGYKHAARVVGTSSSKGFTAPSALHRALCARKGRAHMAVDEIWALLEGMAGPKSTPNKRELMSTMLELHNLGAGGVLDGMEYAKASDSLAPVSSPYLTVLGVTTPENFYKALGEEVGQMGLVNRLLCLVEIGTPFSDVMEARIVEFDPHSDSVLRRIAAGGANVAVNEHVRSADTPLSQQAMRGPAAAIGETATVGGSMQRAIGMDWVMGGHLRQWGRGFEGTKSARMADQAIRIAGLLALADAAEGAEMLDEPMAKPEIKQHHVDYAKRICEHLLANLKRAETSYGAESETEAKVKRTIKVIKSCLDRKAKHPGNYRAWLENRIMPAPLLSSRIFRQFQLGEENSVLKALYAEEILQPSEAYYGVMKGGKLVRCGTEDLDAAKLESGQRKVQTHGYKINAARLYEN